MVLVDNSVYSFAYQIDNGIPIISYYDDPRDEELMHLMFYMKCLSECDDVREKNRNAFELYKLGDGAEVIYEVGNADSSSESEDSMLVNE
jgi:CTD small phosphatase-like protein 2